MIKASQDNHVNEKFIEIDTRYDAKTQDSARFELRKYSDELAKEVDSILYSLYIRIH